MTNNHTTVKDADEGDFGWVWMDTEWVLARINDELLATYPKGYLTQYHELNDDILALPWYSISHPPHDGYEAEPTCVSITDRYLKVIISMNLPDDTTRDDLFQKITRAAHDFSNGNAERIAR